MRRLAVCLAASLVAFTPVADACGDKLVPIGGGVRMERIARTSHPGTVFVLASSLTGTSRASEPALLAGLVKTGHQVRLIETPADLQRAAREQAPDIVLAQAEDLPAAQAQFHSGAGPVLVLVLLNPSRAELEAAHESHACVAAVPDWGVSPVVRVVNSIRASQESGRAIECSERSRPRS